MHTSFSNTFFRKCIITRIRYVCQERVGCDHNHFVATYISLCYTVFKEKERMWAKARHDEAQALFNARQQEREKWQGVAEENERLRKRLAELEAK